MVYGSENGRGKGKAKRFTSQIRFLCDDFPIIASLLLREGKKKKGKKECQWFWQAQTYKGLAQMFPRVCRAEATETRKRKKRGEKNDRSSSISFTVVSPLFSPARLGGEEGGGKRKALLI